MTDESGGSKKDINAGAQAVAAVVVVGGLIGGGWGLGEVSERSMGEDKPAVCSVTNDELPERYASGAALCAALNRPDLPALLGTPEDQAWNARGSGRWITLLGTDIATPEAEIQLKTYTVNLSASYDDPEFDRTVTGLGPTAQRQTVLGHPAVLYSDRTIAITFDLKGGKGSSGPGGIARHVLVAADTKDGGTSFDLTIWREDGRAPDDAALLRIAEHVLPNLPGWSG
ncbi:MULTISPECIES: DUF6215 domain-containing protein [unclassified Streptomyces]|uniref:DUF6215 domain-containing protein n=1 Tax=unclassified Streptomyces TaxID=2593676 RepID=UPI0022530DD7|nr:MULTISPECIES: DUF6215 domain-containing protein [unclassified Streptomyces]MCX4528521.1 DUF6215 domain-containing protein [Streptomyces sp. NBC_01551]MCX4540881.1 DUF6215 domain-containing protein [Streptomyces sp. NBC_01565]